MKYDVIVTRHLGLIEWLKHRGIEAPVISHVSSPDQIKGKHIIGVLPLSLAVHCLTITEVSMPLLTPEQRGKDLTPSEMDEAGADLIKYIPPVRVS